MVKLKAAFNAVFTERAPLTSKWWPLPEAFLNHVEGCTQCTESLDNPRVAQCPTGGALLEGFFKQTKKEQTNDQVEE
jgi:hypothetical protein